MSPEQPSLAPNYSQIAHKVKDSSPTMECPFKAEGVVVTASVNQSMPSFDKPKAASVCVCVCFHSTHGCLPAHTQTATGPYCCGFCGRLTHWGEMGAVKTVCESVLRGRERSQEARGRSRRRGERVRDDDGETRWGEG